MNEDDKIDLIAAILAAGSAEKVGQIVGNFRALRNLLRAEGLDGPERTARIPRQPSARSRPAAADAAADDRSPTEQNALLVSVQIGRDTVLAERDAAQAEIEKLRLLIRQLQRGQFGRRSEKLDPDQLQLGLEEVEQTAAAQEAAATSCGTLRPARTRRRNLGALPAHLPRIEVLIDIEDKSCPCCGGALHPIGEDTSEMLDIVPAKLRVKVIRRPRYACRACEEAVVQAPALERPITGGMATEALLAHVLVAKYADFLPLYRQAEIFARQGHRARPLHLVRLGRPGVLVAGAAVAPAAPACHELDPDLRRRYPAAGARPRPRPDQDRPLVGLCDRRPALERQHPAGGGLPLRREPQRGAPGGAPGRVPGRAPGGRLWRGQELADDAPTGSDQARLLLGPLSSTLL
jgi:transposase